MEHAGEKAERRRVARMAWHGGGWGGSVRMHPQPEGAEQK